MTPENYLLRKLMLPQLKLINVEKVSNKTLHFHCEKKTTWEVSLSTAFAGVEVGVKEMEDGIWVVSFLDYDLGYFDDKSKKVEPITDPFSMGKV